MKTGLIHTTVRHPTIYYKLKRQVVLEFQPQMEGAVGWRRDWLRWKRGITLEIRYNDLLFSKQTSLRSSLIRA
ncbi:hypothetical protein [Spirosoma luteum]|uniref:hypothetical protein n=1 Tax=Spirosoma luteum TaxID=431553 RepID=UPI0003A3958D|nr:hypothetical protein [Spirosoma luteum]